MKVEYGNKFTSNIEDVGDSNIPDGAILDFLDSEEENFEEESKTEEWYSTIYVKEVDENEKDKI